MKLTPSLYKIFPFLIILVSFCLLVFDTNQQDLFRYERSKVLNGELWRLVSAHFTHLGLSHLILNMAVFIPFWFLYGKTFKLFHWVSIITLCALGISLAFLQFDKSLVWYVGFSGVLHGLFIAVALTLLMKYKGANQGRLPLEAAFVLVAIVLKVSYEQIAGPVSLTQKASGGDVIVNAHLYGALLGTVFAIFIHWMEK